MTREEIGDLYIVRRLESGETITAFNCGDEDLNDFITNEASLYNDAYLAITYVIENKEGFDSIIPVHLRDGASEHFPKGEKQINSNKLNLPMS